MQWNVSYRCEQDRRGERLVEIVLPQSFASIGRFAERTEASRLEVRYGGEDDHFRRFGREGIGRDRYGIVRWGGTTTSAGPFRVLARVCC